MCVNIVNLCRMVGKPFVIGFCSRFWTWPCTTFNSIPIILKLLTNRNIALIYSVIICEQQTKDCAQSGSFQHNLQHQLFSTLMFAEFPNQSPLLTMVWTTCSSSVSFLSTLYRIIFLSAQKLSGMAWTQPLGVFHLSELTDHTIPVETRVSLLMKTIQPYQSSPIWKAV